MLKLEDILIFSSDLDDAGAKSPGDVEVLHGTIKAPVQEEGRCRYDGLRSHA